MRQDDLLARVPKIEEKLKVRFQNPALIFTALIHRSFVNENKDLDCDHNERLEFLGDSVLNLIVAEHLFQKHPEMTEGDLSSTRAHIVSSSSCVKFIEKLDIQEFILVGRGEKLQASKGRTSILADAFEAVLGAIYLDSGLAACRSFFFSHFKAHVDEMQHKPWQNYKALLQEHVQKEMHLMPEYRLVAESGPDHARSFEIAVYVDQKQLGKGIGSTKKEAEQEAAKAACKVLEDDS